jgi:hypothetical protein
MNTTHENNRIIYHLGINSKPRRHVSLRSKGHVWKDLSSDDDGTQKCRRHNKTKPMTHQEEVKTKAIQIYHDMLWMFEQEPIDHTIARYCSILAVEEIIEALKSNEWQNRKEIYFYEDVQKHITFYIHDTEK